jgi:filamentous hemagglutinin family protein
MFNCQRWCYGLGLLATGWVLLGPSQEAIAQIRPDRTLGSESSRIVPTTLRGLLIQQIEGGARRGSTLFHSFSSFNVGTDEYVYFASPDGIDTLVSRVTGNAASTIAGTLGVNGSADLFLLNPNGIIFSPTAQLDIRGSFLASTASQFVFSSGGGFSATNPQVPPLLTIEVPIGLQRGQVPQGDIQNNGTLWVDGPSLTLIANNLHSPGSLITDNGTVQLVASNNIDLSASTTLVSTNGGAVTLQAGNDIRLLNGSAINTSIPERLGGGDAGSISLQAGNHLTLQNAALFATVAPTTTGSAGAISLVANGVVTIDSGIINNNLRGDGSGTPIRITGDRIAITNNSRIFAFTDGVGDAGLISLQAEDAIDVDQASQISVGVNPGAVGNGGGIRIQAERFTASTGANLFTFTQGTGDAGTLDIQASDAVVLTDSTLAAGVSSGATGNGGGIRIRTSQFDAENTVILADTAGPGQGGGLFIRARDMTVTGFAQGDRISSIISTNSLGPGRAGNLTIRARNLEITGTRLSTETNGSGGGGDLALQVEEDLTFSGPGVISAGVIGGGGNGGTVRLNVGQLTVQNQGQIASGTFSTGDAGNLTINAREGIRLTGDPAAETRTGLFTQSQGTGQAGTLTIRTPQLQVEDGATISVSGIATGSPGNLQVNTDRIFLTQGLLEARTVSGEGANIQLDVADRLVLRDRSQILTEAQGTGNGGNITITAPFIVAVPTENNDITANAFEGNGGNITITTEVILGLEFRPTLTSLSDITASSEFGLDGTVVINTPDVDPAQGLVELPASPVDAASQIGQICPTGPGAAAQWGRFVITGRGGTVPSPLTVLDTDRVNADWVTPGAQNAPDEDHHPETGHLPAPHLPGQSDLSDPSWQEAQGWILGRHGQIHLVTGTQPMVATPEICAEPLNLKPGIVG